MAYAKSAVEMGLAWSATLEVLDAGSTPGFNPVQSVGVSAIGGSAALSYTAIGNVCAPHSAPPGAEYPGHIWTGRTMTYRLTVGVSGVFPPVTEDYELWIYDYWAALGSTPTRVVTAEAPLTVDVAITVSGIRRATVREENHPTDRELMDFTDMETTDVWVADADNAVTVTAGGLQLSGSLGYSSGATVTIGSSFYFNYAISASSFVLADAGDPIARISDVKWGTKSVPLTYLDLYKPGDSGDIPDPTTAPGWSRTKSTDNCARVGNDGGMAMWAEGTYTSAAAWAGYTRAPYLVTWKPHDTQFSEQSGVDANATFEGAPHEWVLTGSTWAFEEKEWSGDLEWNEFRNSWEREREYQKYHDNGMWVRTEYDWLVANGELVSDELDSDVNDRTCALMLYPLDASQLTGNPYWSTAFLNITHQTSLDVNDPPGVGTRPSLWTGGGGVTVDGADNDHWTVAAGEASPFVARSLATRYWLRMERLADHQDDPWRQHHQDWPLMLKANLPIEETLDDPAWWVSVPYEDITNWANFSYLRVGLTAPKAGSVTLTVNWSVPSVSDPCTTCFEHRFGAEGTWEYSTTPYTATYTFAVVAGANSVQLDLACPNEAFFAVGSKRRHVVTSVRFDLPASGLVEEWTLTDLSLTRDNGDANHSAPSAEGMGLRYLRNWAWIASQWAGFSGRYNGMPCLEADSGYNSSSDAERYALQSVQHRQHCPDSEATDRIDVAKALSRLWTELSWQEGFEVGAYPDVESSAHNEDSDGARMCVPYWFDLKHSDETGSTHYGAPTCKTWNICAGVPYEIHFWKHPRGEVDGCATNSGWTQRRRSSSGVVVESSDDGGAWTAGPELSTDEHGRFHTAPVRERDYRYRVVGQSDILTVDNRQYTWAKGTIPTPGGDAVAMFAHPSGLVKYTVGIVNDSIIVYRLDDATANTWVALPTVDSSGDYDCVGGEHDGRVIHVVARNRNTQALWQWYSTNEGDDWTGPTAL